MNRSITIGVLEKAFLMYKIAAFNHNSWAPGSQIHVAAYLYTLKEIESRDILLF